MKTKEEIERELESYKHKLSKLRFISPYSQWVEETKDLINDHLIRIEVLQWVLNRR